MTIAPPGRLPLKNTLFSLVDVPDLRVALRAVAARRKPSGWAPGRFPRSCIAP